MAVNPRRIYAQVQFCNTTNLGSIEVIKRFEAIGLGLAIVPRVAVMDEVRTGQVVAAPVHGLPVREIGLVERLEKRRSAATAFLQLLRASITHHPLENAEACVGT